MEAWNLPVIAAASADGGQYTIGVIIFVALITALFTSLMVVHTYGNSLKKRESDSSGESGREPRAEAAPAKAVAPTASDAVGEEVVAVIAAAVASMAPEGRQYRIKSVRSVRAQRPVWAAAGLAENTRPF